MMLSDEEIIKIASKLWEANAFPTRALFRKAIPASQERMEKMHAAGLIKFPPRVPKGMCRVFKKNDKWGNFRLPGSPTTREVNHG